jgi:hypothetical protein
MENVIEELEILPTCDASVPLVIIGPEIMGEAKDHVIAKLSDLALDVPFLLANQDNVPADRAKTFRKVCEYRTEFRQEQYPELANVLRESGHEVTCN